MNANKTFLFALLVVVSAQAAEPPAMKIAAPAPPAPSGTTIGQLSEMARQKRVAEATKPAAPMAVPAGMTIVPSTSIIPAANIPAGAAKPAQKKSKPVPPPEVVPGLLAIAKLPNGMRYVEMADTSGPNRYTVGQATPSGWVVEAVGNQFVELSKPAANKKPARSLTLSLAR